jgi:hypothetical protein
MLTMLWARAPSGVEDRSFENGLCKGAFTDNNALDLTSFSVFDASFNLTLRYAARGGR